jgi:chromosome segregation ATPase
MCAGVVGDMVHFSCATSSQSRSCKRSLDGKRSPDLEVLARSTQHCLQEAAESACGVAVQSRAAADAAAAEHAGRAAELASGHAAALAAAAEEHRGQLHAVHAELAAAHKQLQQRSAALGAAQAAVHTSEQMQAEAAAREALASARCAERDAVERLAAAERELQGARGEAAALRERLQASEQALAESTSTVQQLGAVEARARSSERELEVARGAAEAARADVGAALARAAAAETDARNTSALHQRALQECGAAKGHAQNQATELAEATKKLNASNAQRAALSADLDRLRGEAASMRSTWLPPSEAGALRKRLAEQTEAVPTLEARVESLSSDLLAAVAARDAVLGRAAAGGPSAGHIARAHYAALVWLQDQVRQLEARALAVRLAPDLNVLLGQCCG